MCLSTPTTTQNGNNTSSPSQSQSCSSSPCSSAASNGSVSVCGNICPQKQTELDCNGNTTTVSSIKQRKTERTTATLVDEQNTLNAKDLADNLGYKEENAVYKECIKAKEKLQREQMQEAEQEFKPQLRYPDLIAQLFLHVGAVYGFYLLFSAKFYTFLWGK